MCSLGNIVLATAPPAPAKRGDLSKTYLIWIDLEMTGLDHETDHILEVGCVITNSDFEIIGESIDLVIHNSDAILSKMNDWTKEHYSQSGLLDKCRESTVSLLEAEDSLLSFLKQHTPKGACPLAGNSVYVDKLFLKKYMPKVNGHLHYRTIDVSTVKELYKRWSPVTFTKVPPKKHSHMLIDEIYESVSELKFFKKYFPK